MSGRRLVLATRNAHKVLELRQILAGALDRGEPWGVWGGEIFDRGVVIARKRPRGRPRKVTAA